MLRSPAIRSSWLALVLAVLLAACQPKAIPMTPEETQRVDSLTAHMTTRCVGRYLIDLPERFVLNSESTTEIEGVKIAVKPMDKTSFNYALETREMVLRRETIMGTYWGENVPSLLSATKLSQGDGMVFNRSRTGEEPVSRTLELMAFRDGYAIALYLDAEDRSFAKRVRPEFRSDTPEKLAHLLKVYERVSGRKDTEVLAEQGVCIPNGFVRGTPSDQESLQMRYLMQGSDDVGLEFQSFSDIREETELLDRGKGIEAKLKEMEGRTLRKGKALAQIPGAQEWLMTMKSSSGSGLMWHHLTLEANSKIGSANAPVLIVDLDAGGGHRTQPKDLEEAATRKPIQQNTFTEAETIAIWDRITATLRPRPGAF